MLINDTKRRPRVLLLGNGLQRCFMANSVSLSSLLNRITTFRAIPDSIHDLPFGLEVVLRTGDAVNKQIKAIAKEFDKELDDKEYMSVIRDLLSLGFDDIITTNYDFHLESVALGVDRLSDYRYSNITHNQKQGKKAEGKFFIHTAQTIDVDGGNILRIWHVHGHARNPDSMILGHYYYGNHLYKIKEHVDHMRNRYERAILDDINVDINSWIDSFILGDVYILGFGFDFAESDLWWLINRKARERDEVRGRTYFYEPKENAGFDEKKELLNVYGVDTCKDCGVSVIRGSEESKTRRYKLFYKKAIEDIRNRINA